MRLKGVIAVDNEPLYDTITLPSVLSPGEYTWFSTGLGGTIDTSVNAGLSKQRCETNMVNNGRLPEPERFEIVAFRIVPDFTANTQDWAKVLQRSYLEIRVGGGTTPMHRTPLRTVTAGAGFLYGGAAATGIMSSFGWPDPAAIPTFAPDTTVVVELNENFSVVLVVCSTQTLSGGSALIPAMCILEGFHAKGVRKG